MLVLIWSLMRCRDDEFEQKTTMKRMNYVSAQLMKGRGRGTHKNYLHRLYAEGLEDLDKKRRQVILPSNARSSWLRADANPSEPLQYLAAVLVNLQADHFSSSFV